MKTLRGSGLADSGDDGLRWITLAFRLPWHRPMIASILKSVASLRWLAGGPCWTHSSSIVAGNIWLVFLIYFLYSASNSNVCFSSLSYSSLLFSRFERSVDTVDTLVRTTILVNTSWIELLNWTFVSNHCELFIYFLVYCFRMDNWGSKLNGGPPHETRWWSRLVKRWDGPPPFCSFAHCGGGVSDSQSATASGEGTRIG